MLYLSRLAMIVALLLPTLSPAQALDWLGIGGNMTPLHEAALRGDTEVVKSWIANKRNLDAPFSEPSRGLEGNYSRRRGLTALMFAATAGRLEIVKLLVEGGANLYAESTWRDGSNAHNAFDYALESNRVAVAEYLWSKSDGIRFGKYLAAQIGNSCWQYCNDRAGMDEHSNLTLFLISITRDEQVLVEGIGHALSSAPQPLEAVQFLDRHGVRFPRNILQFLAMHGGSHAQQIAVATLLLDRGADSNARPYSPLIGAVRNDDIDMIKLLLSRGADVNGLDAKGMTPMGAGANTCVGGGLAAETQPALQARLKTLEFLVEAGADAKVYASERAMAQLGLLRNCCQRSPQADSQRRICAMFGL